MFIFDGRTAVTRLPTLETCFVIKGTTKVTKNSTVCTTCVQQSHGHTKLLFSMAYESFCTQKAYLVTLILKLVLKVLGSKLVAFYD